MQSGTCAQRTHAYMHARTQKQYCNHPFHNARKRVKYTHTAHKCIRKKQRKSCACALSAPGWSTGSRTGSSSQSRNREAGNLCAPCTRDRPDDTTGTNCDKQCVSLGECLLSFSVCLSVCVHALLITPIQNKHVHEKTYLQGDQDSTNTS